MTRKDDDAAQAVMAYFREKLYHAKNNRNVFQLWQNGVPAPPDTYFKYMTAPVAKVVIENMTLRWSSPILFNDPFDLKHYDPFDGHSKELLGMFATEVANMFSENRAPKYGRFVDLFQKMYPAFITNNLNRDHVFSYFFTEEIEQYIMDALKEEQTYWIDRTRSFRVLCLSAKSDNLLMWSHYADAHRGIALGIRRVKERFTDTAKPVEYKDARPVFLSAYDRVMRFTGQERPLPKTAVWELALTKSTCWEYEEEWRCLDDDENDYPLFTDNAIDGSDIESIIFGCQIDEEHKTSIIDLVGKTRVLDHVRLYQSRIDQRSYQLNFHEVIR